MIIQRTFFVFVITAMLSIQPGFIIADDTSSVSRKNLLNSCKTWMYQIQDLDKEGAVATLAATDYPLLVIEPGHNFSDFSYDTLAIVNALKTLPDGKKRLVLAYIDIGQAEDYRSYWGEDWIAPTAVKAGYPDFLVTIDPDGWSGNFTVAYWKQEWKNLWLGNTGIIATLANYGFDGIYLDWVEAYDDEKVQDAASREGVEPDLEMIKFIEELGQAGKAVISDFLVVPQNAPFLIDTDTSRYVAAIDALAVEDTWYHGAGDADWNDPDAGDLHERHDDEWSTENRLRQYKLYQNSGLPVFSVDYCISTQNATQVYQEAATAGLIPLVTRVSLSKLTETPPSLPPPPVTPPVTPPELPDTTDEIDGGYTMASDLWLKAVLKPEGGAVALVWKEVGSDTTPSGDKVVSGYYYADPKDFAYGSEYNPEVFIKIYIAKNGWANIAINHVTVDDVDVFSAIQYSGTPDQTGTVSLSSRLVEHQYTGVGLQ